MATYTGKFSNLLEDSTQDTSTNSNVGADTSQQTYQGKFSNLISPSTSTTVGEPSDFEKFKYGTAKELTLLGELYDLSKAFYHSYGDLTFEESRQKVKEERNKKLLENFTWAKGGQYDNDAMVWGGRTAQMLLDPIYLLMPWGRAAQAGKLLGKGGAALAGLGAGVGSADVGVRSFSNTGEIKLTDVALGAGLGAVLSPVAMGVQKGLGTAANKLFPNLFKNTKMKDAVNDELRGNFKSKYGLNDDQLNNVYKISSLKSIQNLANSVDNNYKLFVKPLQELEDALIGVGKTFTKGKPFRPDQLTNIIKQMPGGLELKFKSIGNKTLSTVKTKKQFENVQKEITTEVNQLVDKQIKKSNRLNFKLQIKIVEELHKAGGLTAQVGRALTSVIVRPAVGAGGGAVFATVADLDDEGFAKMVAGGAVIGAMHRHLMRGGIKSIPLPKQIGFAKILKSEYWNNLGRALRITTAGTQQSKLTARGPVLDEFSNSMFYRPTDTVRTTWLGKIAKNQDESIGMIGTGNSVEERMERSMANWGRKIVDEVLADADPQTQKLAISIVRGKKGVKDKSAQDLAKRIKNYLDEFRVYYKEVGFEEKELLKNYFPRKFNFAAINKDKASQDDFINRVAQAYVNIGKAKDMTKGKELAGIYMRNLEGHYKNEIFDEKSLLKIWKGEKADAKLPISEHIELERRLHSKKGVYAEVEELLDPYLVNDVGTVLMDLARTSVKSVEFARTFGKDGSLLSSYLRRLSQQYKDNGFSKGKNYYEGGQHQADVDSLRHAVNSYFGRYGRRGTDAERSLGAVLSTLANFNMMDKVTIANLGDLIQPFQNSRHLLSAIRGMWQSASSDMAIRETKIIRSAVRNAYVTADGGSSPFLMEKGNANVMSFIGKSNEWFFKAIGLEAITGIARRYAYNVGAIDSHKSAQRLINRWRTSKLKSLNDLKDSASLRDIKHLHKTGVIKLDSNLKVLNSDDVIAFGLAKNLNEAGKNESVRSLINIAGNQAANRDAIIPTVGNRLLFTQTRNPLVRIIGQFSSWAMAKSAQTNAMISRVEDGNLRTGIAMLGALSMFGAVKNLRDFARTGEWEMDRELDKDPGRWLAFATQMSGNLGWLPTTINNSMLTTYGNTPVEFFPAVSIFNEFGTALRDTGGAFLDKNGYDDAIRSWMEFAPAPTVRAILDRAGFPFMVYKKDVNMLDAYKKSNIFKGTSLFSKGGLASEARQLFSTGELVEPKIKPQQKIKTDYQYDLKTEIDTTDVSDKKELNKIIKNVVIKKKPDRFQSELAQSESSGRYDVVNKQGYMGKYQFGEARLTDYRDATGEKFTKEKFINDKELQEKVFKWHTDDYKKRIVNDGLDKFIGTKINGVDVTLNGLLAVAHLGGYTGMTKFLETQGQYNKKDKNGTTLFDYLKRYSFNRGGLTRQKYGVGDAVRRIAIPLIKHSLTQIPNTKSTYKKFNNIFKDYNATESLLDYASGLGKGTQILKGKKVISLEPYAQHDKITKIKGRLPDYEDVGTLIQREGRNSQTGVANHMVLNVIDDKLKRDLVVKTIGNLLKKDGIGIITTRDKIDAVTKKPYLDGFLVKKDGQFTFQKGFKQKELKNYITGILGDTFEILNIPKKYEISGSGVIIKKLPTPEKGKVLSWDMGGKAWYKSDFDNLWTNVSTDKLLSQHKLYKGSFEGGAYSNIDKHLRKKIPQTFEQYRKMMNTTNVAGNPNSFHKIVHNAESLEKELINRGVNFVSIKIPKVKLSEGGQVRQLLNGGGSTYRRNARESYIASSNKPKASSSNTNKPPTEKVWDESKKDDPTTKVDYTSKPSDDGGNGKVKKVIKKVVDKTKDTGKYIIGKAKEDRYFQSNLFPEKGSLLYPEITSLLAEGAYGETGFTNEGQGDNLFYKVGVGVKSSSPVNITEPTKNQLDTSYAQGTIGMANEFGALGVGVGYSDDTFSGNVTQTFDQPSILDKYIGEDKISPYVSLGKSEGEDLKVHGGIQVNFKSGGLLDRKRS